MKPTLLRSLILLCLISFRFIGHAQNNFNCDPNVQNTPVAFNGVYNTQTVNFAPVNQGAGWQCCNQASTYTCATYTLTTVAGNNAFNITTGPGYNGTALSIHVNDCNTALAENAYFCVPGAGVYQISVCSDATQPFDLNFNAIGAPEIQSQSNVTNGCSGYISAIGINPGTIDINSTNPGTPGQYNGLFDCSTNCQEFIGFTPNANSPASITYQICGDALVPACQDPDVYCSNITFNIAPSLTVTGLENDVNVCAGANYPPITATVNGGLPQYSYIWSGPNIDPVNPPPGNTINNVIQGTYQLTVYDQNGCASGPHDITYTEIPLPTVNAGQDQSYCSPQSPIQLSGSGGLGTNLTWSGSGSFDNPNFPSPSYTPTMAEMNVGTFQLTVTGSNTCGSATDNVSITFNTANGISLTPSITDITCFGTSTGAVSVVVNNGSNNYSYSWSNGATSASINNVPAGIYSVIVNDLTYGCSTSASYTVNHLNGPPAFSVNLQATNPTCSNTSNGSVVSSLNGGIFPFTYTWSNGLGNNPDLFNLGAGTYSLSVLDGNGCQATASATLIAPQPLVITETVTNISCNGLTNGSISTVITGGTPGYTYAWGPNGETFPGLFNLSAGNYSLNLTDLNGCTASENYTIVEPDELSASGIVTNNVCNGQSFGAVNVTSGGGVLPYTYDWNSGQFNTEDISGLSAGSYVFELTDANNCDILVPFLVTEPAAINVNPSLTNITCFGLTDGIASTTPTGGTGNLSVLWNTGSTSNTITGLAAGNYTVTITDGNSCVNSSTITIIEPSQLLASATITNAILCNGAIGEITVSASGGTPQYTGTGSFLVGAGTYTYTVTDLNDCNANTTIIINQPQAISVNANSTNAACFGGSSGSINVSVSGGTGNFAYAWTGPNNFTSNNQNISSLSSGLYTLTVADQNNCTQTSNTFITEPTQIQSSAIITNVLCFGGNNGAINITPSGGSGVYNFAWTGPNNFTATTEDINGLFFGTYTVSITDNTNCSSSFQYNVSEPSQLSASINVLNPIACNGGTAVIEVVASGGTPNYSGTGPVSGLVAGPYTYNITDANNCPASASITITEPVALAVSTSQTNVACNGGNDGSATATVTGGTAPYSYNWSNNGNTATISTLTAGTYSLIVNDNNGCTNNLASVTITEPAALALTTSSTPASCTPDGSVTVSVSGGTGNYSYAWAPGGATTANVTGLAAGIYTVTVTDANGCTASASQSVGSLSLLSASASITAPILCNGQTATVDVTATGGTGPYTGTGSFANVAAGNVTYTVTDANGCTASTTITVTEPSQLTASINVLNPIACNGGTAVIEVVASGGTPNYSGTGPVSGLVAGPYTYNITDANNCTASASITITEPNALAVSTSQTNVACNGGNDGSATATITGGTAPYSYNWSNSGNTATISTLTAGNYSLIVTDNNGCTNNLASVTITEPADLALTTSSTPASCSPDGSVSVNVTGGTGNYSYAWAPGGATTANVTGLAAGIYTVTVTDANGCTASVSQSVGSLSLLSASASITAPILCNGQTATVDVTATGGTGPYTGTGSFANVAAGTITYTVTDANNCSASTTITVTQPSQLSASINVLNPIACNGGTAVIEVVASGGTPNYSGTGPVSGLVAGPYTYNITDANNCPASASITITEPVALAVSTSQTNVTCNSGNDGSATATVTGGTAPYSYNWSNNGNTATISTLTAGTYSLIVNDNNGCTNNLASVTITEPAALALTTSSTPASCTPDGSVTVSVSGGTGNYTYAWAPGGATTANVTGLAAGIYTVTVTDANGCTASVSQSVGSLSLLSASASITAPILCNGQTATVDVTATGGTGPYTGTGSFANVAAGTITYTVTDANNCSASTTITVTQPSQLSASINVLNPIACNGGTAVIEVVASGGTPNYSGTGPVSGLIAGPYTYNITDANNCSASASITITEPVALTVSTSQTNVTCNGGNDGSATATVTGGTAPYSYNWSNNGNTATISTLTAGTYSLIVNDNNGCTNNLASVTITEPAALALTTSSTPASCNPDGSVSVTVSGGTGNYTYAWAPGGATTANVTGLAAGIYTVTVTDANGCTATASQSVGSLSLLSASASITAPILCNGQTATVDVTATGGTGPYTGTGSFANVAAGTITYTVTDANNCSASTTITVTQPSQLSASINVLNPIACNGGTAVIEVVASGGTPNYSGTGPVSGLVAGPYTYNITDANNCPASASITITEPVALTVSTSQTNVTCNGGNDGSATATVTGGTAPYSYNWSNNGNTATISTLTAGTYSLIVNDNNGCTNNLASVTITEPAALALTTSSTPASCTPDGSVTVSVSGGTGNYTYAWAPGGATTANVTGLAAGIYTVTVTDANGCTATASQSVGSLSLLSASASITAPILCNGQTATVDVTATGGTGPYTGTGSFANVAAGTITYTVTDANNCSASTTITVTQPSQLSASINVLNPIACNGGTAVIEVVASGGTPNYSGTGPVSGLIAGPYTYNITDANNCSASASITITEPVALTVSTSQTNVTCNGGNDGSATATVTGGTAPYSYNWSNNGNTATISTLTAGTYSLIVNDNNGCTNNLASVTITEPAALALTTSSTPASCTPDGSVTVSVSGGTGNYTYTWAPGGATTANVTGLAAGIYTVTVTDANGCTATASQSVGSLSLLSTSASITAPILCNGQTATVDVTATGGTGPYTGTGSFANVAAGTITYTVTDANNCSASTTITVTQPSQLSASINVLNPIACNGGTAVIEVVASGGTPNYSGTGPVSGLIAGPYTYNITDANNCSASASITITEPVALTVSTSQTNVTCNGGNDGSATATVTGGTAPYSYNWSNNGNTATISTLTAGTYSLIVNDNNGCTNNLASVTITEPAALALTTSSTPASCTPDGSVTVSVSGGTGNYTYTWAPGGATTANVTGLAAGIYTVTVTDANGCTATASQSVGSLSLLSASASITAPILCNGQTATVDVTATGGTGPYTGTGSFANVAAGNVTYTVTDANGCSGSTNLTVTEPAAITSSFSNTNVLCNGASTGAIDLTIGGGIAPYSQTWSNNAITEDISGLSAGTFSVTINDANGCSSVFNTTLSEPTAIQLSTSVTDVSCFGNATGSIDLNVIGGVGPYTYSWDNGSSNQDISNLIAGSYTVTVTDNNNCSSQTTAIVNQPAAGLSVSNTTTNVLCNGAASGSIDITLTGGTGPFTFLWNDNSTQEDISNLVAGNYNVIVTDNNNCSNQFNFSVTQPTSITVTSINTDILCNGSATGGIDLNVTGGTGSYSFNWSNNATTEDITGIPFGSYSVNILDNNGCAVIYNTSINQPPQITLTKSSIDVDCFGASTGSINITVNGGVPGYSYSWNNGANTEDLSNITAGTYSLTVTDANGCTASTSATVNEPAALALTTSSTPASCSPDGTVSVNVTGGTGNYSYAWAPGGATSANVTGLAAGIYTVTVTDANGCTASASQSVGSLSLLSASASITAPILCNGQTATVDVTATGGTGPYTGTGSFANVAAGNVTYTVTDANGCTASTTITVTEPAALSISVSTTDATCAGANNGTAVAFVTGGTAGYSYLWSNALTSNPITNLAPGNITLTVTDANGCTSNANGVINEPAPITATVQITDVTCNGLSDGIIDVTVAGGTPGYSFIWDDPASSTTEDINTLAQGTYNLIITDANGCTASTSATVNEPAALALTTSSTPASCSPDGTVSVNVTGGTGNYSYAWAPGGATSANVTGLAAGIYTVTVTDANGCTASASQSVGSLSLLSASASITSPILCNGQTATVDVTATGGTGPYTGTGSFANVAAGNVTYSVTDANGCTASTTLTVSEPAALSVSLSTTDATCAGANNGTAVAFVTGGTAGYSYLWSNALTSNPITNLAPGNITLTVTDANGCTSNANGVINEPAPITATVQITDVTCNGLSDGIIDVTVAGGTPGYSFIWDDPASSTTEDINTLAQGTYNLIITDANGCTASTSATVNEPAALALTTSSTPASCSPDGTVSVNVTGGTGNYSYAWAPGGATSANVTGLAAGIYTVTVTDANGCTASASQSVGSLSLLSASASITAPILCNGQTATVDVTATGGTGPYTGTGSFANVAAGNVTYTVTDANGCTASTTITVTEPAALSISVSTTDATCAGANNGTAVAFVTGGTAGYSYLWSNALTSNPITNLAPGNITLTVTDANGCTSNANGVINEPAPITATVQITDVTCNGLSDGIIDVTVAGGTPGYSFIWDDPASSTTEDINTLAQGTYNLIITDANGCTASTSATVNEPAALALTTSSTPASCSPDGTVSVNVTGGTGNYSYAWAPGGATSANVTGLAAGIYTVTVTDANGCTASASQSVGSLSLLSASASITAPILCNGQTATVDVTATGGTGPYTGTGSFANVAAGNVTYTVTDANGCTASTTITVTEPAALSISVSTTDATCAGANNGTAVAFVTGGTAGYSYLWSNALTSNPITNLAPGNITLIVTDANGCTSNANGVINEPAPITATVQITDVTCNGLSDGIIDVTVAGGTPGYSFIWDDPASSTTEDINTLAQGTYNLIITDANGCTASTSATVNEPNPLVVSSTITSPIVVNGGQGIISVSAVGGVAPYNGTGTFNEFSGTYTYIVTDANGCTSSTTITITEPNALQASATISSIIPCNGGNGIIDVTATGGIAPYTGTGSFTVVAGTYTYTVVDGAGTTSTVNISITEPALLAATATSTNVTCNGVNNGTASVTETGGTAPYTYLWSNGPTTANVSNLAPGAYSVTVTDANGCTAVANVTITEPALLVANATSTNVTCNGLNNGTANVTETGGTAPYTYLWSNGPTTANVSNLAPGAYSVTVTDANGCTAVANVTITEPALLVANATSTNVTCNGLNNGTANVTETGGTAPYTYLWSNGPTTANVSNLAPGAYSVTVTDANGCTAVANVIITEPALLVATATSINVTCNGLNNGTAIVTETGGTAPYTYLWSNGPTTANVSSLAPGAYSVTVTDANGCTAVDNVTITEPALLVATATSTNVTCNGLNNGTASVTETGGTAPYTYLWSNGPTTANVSSLAPGAYSVTVTDANGCTAVDNVTITEPALLVATATSTNVTCNGLNNGTAIVTETGGTAPYSYLWSNGPTTANVSSLVPGAYSVTVTDANGCTAVDNVTITEPALLVATATSTNVTCNGLNNGTAIVTETGGTAPYTYLWSNGPTTANVSNLAPGTYSVIVSDANGCTAVDNVTITEPPLLVATTSSTNITCNGLNNGSASVIASGGTAPFTYSWSNGPTTANVSNLAPGTYSVTVTDANGCTVTSSVTITQPTSVVANSSVTQTILCNGGTGQISVIANGGTLPYSGIGVNTVVAGTYTYTVSDANGCSNSTTISITEPTALTLSIVGIDPLCNGNSNGSATATVNGGTAPYTYSWTNGSLTNQAVGLSAGSYSVIVTDANGCLINGNIILNQPGTLSASSAVTSPILCFGGSGQVTVSANGGTLPYTGTGVFNVVTGNNSYTVTDANGCTASTSIIVPQPTQVIASSAIASPIPCFGGNGNIIVTATGGTPTYTGTGSFSVPAGTYTYTVTDANGCTNASTITISQPSALTPAANVTTAIPCFGGTGTVTVSAIGGTPTYNGTGNFTSTAGIQNYTVTDANGCSASVSINVVQPSLLTSSINSQNVTCNGLNNGSATVTAAGGTPVYSYFWSNGNTTSTATNLSPGAYSVTVTDANGCQSVSNVVITQPTLLTSSLTQTSNVLCFGGTANVFVAANGGTAPYTGTGTFSVVAGNTFFTVSDANGCTSTSSILITQPPQLIASASQISPILCFGGQAIVTVSGNGGTPSYNGTGSFNSFAGNNTYTIQDANGCTASSTINITQPSDVTATFNNSNVTCFGFTNGASTASVSGGTPGYTYLWSTGSTINSISAQPAGTYTLQVTDNNGCIFNFNTTITQPALLVSTANIILPIACFGGQAIVLVNGAGGTPPYSGNGTFFEFAGTYTYTLTDQNGCTGSTTINVPQPAPFIATATITNPIPCNGGQATVIVTGTGGTAPYTGTGTFNVTAGTYTYTLIDANGCTATTTITVTQPAVLNATATIISPILCNGGSATVQVTATGGSIPYSGVGNFSVVAGNYTYLVSDANGCNTSVSINVPQPTLLVTNVIPTNISCFGANDGSAIVFNSGGTPPLSILWSNGATTNSISNLAPGNYNVTVTDANGCQNINNFTITQPNVLVATAVELTPILCFGGNAIVNVSATGGTNPYSGTGNFFPIAGTYSYIVSDAQGCSDTASITITQPTQLTAVATIISTVPCFGGQAQINIAAVGGVAPYTGVGNFNVSAGNQSFTVTDANGCAFTVNLFIAQPAILSSVITSQNVTCFNAGNGTATVTPNGGTPGYQYLWSNGQTTATATNLVPGLYSVNITDTNGCQTTNQVTITQPTVLQVNSSLSTPVFCFGGTATVNVSASGGTAPYTGTGSFQQGAGTTTYYVTDGNGCLDSTTITVTQPAPLIASVLQTSTVLCFGGTATVDVTAIGGTPNYTGTGTFTVAAGWNTFNVTDNYGCIDTISIFVSQPTLLVANSTLISPILCNGGNAVIDITATGGTPSYTGTGNLTVTAGTYTYTVTDANGCTANTTITVNQPAILQAIATVTSPIVCNGGTGTITVSGVGGTAPYTGVGSFNVPAGTYTYNLVDANGCQASVTITLNQPPVLSISLTQINVNCNGFATGSITANPAGGQGPYSYLWSNGQTSQTISNLIAGTYTVLVTDNLGCTINGSATITQPAAPILLQETHVNVLCFGNNTGSINLTVSGGTSPYSYQWSNGSTNQDINNLIAGTYNVTVTDANGCTAVLSVNVTQPALPLSVGYTVSNVSCFGLADGAIDVTPLGGTGPFTYFWTTGQTSEDLNNVPPGTYIVAITDANNCVAAAQIVVTQPSAPLSGTITQNPISCYGYNDGQLTANASGGTAPYNYLWSPTGQTGNIASLLGPGNYIVTITDANGCTAVTNDVLASPPPLIANFTVSDNVVCLPSTVTFTNSSIGTFSTVLWTFSNGTTYSSNQFTANFTNLGCVDVTMLITSANGCTADTTINSAVCVVPGPTAAFSTVTPEIDFVTGELEFINNSQNYTGSVWQFGDGGSSILDNPIHTYPPYTIDNYNVTLVVYDANGCTDTVTGIVESNDVVRLTVPNAFTPNGDGLNDVFTPVISNSTQVKYYRFEVYNRWGQIVFESNKPGDGWDGKYKGKLVQFGTYTWKVSYDVTDQGSTNADGHVTLVK